MFPAVAIRLCSQARPVGGAYLKGGEFNIFSLKGGANSKGGAYLKGALIRAFTVYSQLSLRRTPSGLASAVRLREVSGL